MGEQFTKESRFTKWKAGDRVLIEAIVESVFDGVSNWPIKILLDRGDSETIDSSRNVFCLAIHPLETLNAAAVHDDLVKALEAGEAAYQALIGRGGYQTYQDLEDKATKLRQDALAKLSAPSDLRGVERE